MDEPRLTAEDRRVWDVWSRAALTHSRTLAFQRKVESAQACAADAFEKHPNACASWSGGKDSTAMVHLLASMGVRVPVGSEKDDLDFPGEVEYVERVAEALQLDLRILRPAMSPRAWLEANADQIAGDDDLHSRAAGLSKACFYDVVEAFSSDFEMTFLGLRAEESRGRRMNRRQRGRLYEKKSGHWICQPIADWRGIDVFAYVLANDIEILPVYRCLAFAHADQPWQIRKSWWVPGGHAATGGAAWLARYYPSLFRQLCEWIPRARMLR